ncbi:MAG: L-threonylcarbamoyladenylate synthase [Rhodospirillales bacterium]|nr:L-threonylcarbamoyladenylate synthase [Rhodospirillales bacterium]MDE0712461.1 L-threonylcarbamoyladenylate synthase [Rhodospirillales bacterium]
MLATAADIRQAAAHLRNGRLVAFPTETVYGLGADATNADAVGRVFLAKNRPAGHPLIIHTATTAAAFAVGAAEPAAARLAERFWPGPLTLVLPLRSEAGIADAVTGGRSTVAVRVPHHPVAAALLRAVGRPVAAPSANPHGRLSPTEAQHVRDELGPAIDLVLDGGPTEIGLESTVLELVSGRSVLLRAGGITVEDLEAVIGPVDEPGADETARAPGMLRQHYAPRTPLRLDADDPLPDEVYLGFGAASGVTCNLSPTGDLEEAARNLFVMLRRLDRAGARRIAVAPIPDYRLGKAINDRLRRAERGAASPGGPGSGQTVCERPS